ncbi:unnamed protein product, partial [Rotaria sp. Silwood2]
ASDKLRRNALNSVQYTEFCLSSCNYGSNDSIRIGKTLVSFLGSYFPYLETLRLWRPDDFPWTSSKSIFQYKKKSMFHDEFLYDFIYK